MSIFDIQKDHMWRHGNIMNSNLNLGQAIEYFCGLQSMGMFDTLGMFYDGCYATMSKPPSNQGSFGLNTMPLMAILS
jgi:hypothetical protein